MIRLMFTLLVWPQSDHIKRLLLCYYFVLRSFYNVFQPCMIAKEGYPVETHTVTTDDGYILQVRY